MTSKFRVPKGRGPLGVKGADMQYEFGPFLEGAEYICSQVFTDEVKKTQGRKWLKAGKIEVSFKGKFPEPAEEKPKQFY